MEAVIDKVWHVLKILPKNTSSESDLTCGPLSADPCCDQLSLTGYCGGKRGHREKKCRKSGRLLILYIIFQVQGIISI